MADGRWSLKPAERERLALLAEEMGEAIQVVGKILRHGYESFNPCAVSAERNRQLLVKEVGDVLLAVRMMFLAGDIGEGAVDARIAAKTIAIRPYLHHQPKTVTERKGRGQ